MTEFLLIQRGNFQSYRVNENTRLFELCRYNVMEELLAYAYLLGMDLISETIYEEKLNELFGLLKPIYQSMDIHRFGSAMYSLWENLAGNLQDMEPFWTLSYADDPLSWKDVEQTRKIYEHMLNYYER